MAASLRNGSCGIAPIAGVPTENLIVKIGAEVRDFVPTEHFEDKRLSLLDRCAQLALVASREAVASSGLDFRGALGLRSAAIVGSGVGGMGTLDENYYRLYGQGAKRLVPYTIPKLMISAAVSHLTMEHGIRGPAFTIASACSSGTHAIGTAFQMVRSGMVEAALAGGTESVFTFGTLKAWEAMRILAPDTCRPFSLDRKGLVLGEGAGMVVLEDYQAARARGAAIWGEILGFGMSADALDIVQPSLDGASRAMRACLADASLAPEDIDYVNAHGSGTAANDVTESRAIRAVFGAHAGKLAVSSTKSMHGHALGAAGALEVAATLIGMRDGFVPPTMNFTTEDPDCGLDVVPNTARPAQIRASLSNSFAFGGLNAVLAMGRG